MKSKMKMKCSIYLYALTLAVLPQIAFTQSKTVFKCTEGEKTVYSDAPCLGAKKVDVQPTRGLNKFTGREAIGSDVAREKQREAFAAAIKPITGMSANELAISGRRSKLSVAAQQECQKLDGLIPVAERAELNAVKKSAEMKLAQTDLYRLRVAYRNNGCD